MSLVNNFKNMSQAALHALKPKTTEPAAPAAPSPQKAPAKPTAGSLQQTESLSTKPTRQGTAQISLPQDNDKMIAAWRKAGQGQKLDLGKDAGGLSPLQNVMKYASSKYSNAELDTIRQFMSEVSKEYGSKEINFILAEGIRENGITAEQIDMLAKGDFSAAAYVSMVKDGHAIV